MRKQSLAKQYQGKTGIWWTLLNKYIDWMKVKNFSPFTSEARYKDIVKFIIWAEERLLLPKEITLSQIERYQSKIAKQLNKKGKNLQANSQCRILTAIKAFFSYLAKVKYLEFNPATEIEFPKQGARLPKHILTHKEVELIIKQIDISSVYGLRDKAILELLYSTGLRRAELAKLKLKDIDLSRGMLFVRSGKGGKDRCIPLGERALAWVEIYITQSREKLLSYREKHSLEGEVEELFINRYGEAFKIGGVATVIKYYIKLAEIPEGSCHMFRHTMATLMLENGADIRYIQQMLGHSNLTTTQVYTKVSDRMLQQVHSRTHPGARLLGKGALPLQGDKHSENGENNESNEQDEDNS